MHKQYIEQAAMIHGFNQAANDYDQFANLQALVAEQLMERLAFCKIAPKMIIDLGCGTGRFTDALQQTYPDAKVIGIDIAPGMLAVARERYPNIEFQCHDAQQLPGDNFSVDLIFSSMMLHWAEDLSAVFQQCRRLLSLNGLLTFSLMGLDSLQELRHCWAQIDDAVHVNQFPDMHNVGDMLLQSVFADPVMDREMFKLQYPDVLSLMRHLKAMGVQNANVGRRRTLSGKSVLQRLQQTYAQQFTSDDGKLNASFEVIYGQAWGTGVEPQSTKEASVSIDSIKRKS